MSTYVSLNSPTHADIRLNRAGGYGFCARDHLVSVVLHEFPKVCVCYPIVFVGVPGDTACRPMALLSLEAGRNGFVDAHGSWTPGHYVPAAFRRHPFALAAGDDESYHVCIDSESPLLSRTVGERLFDEQGAPSPTLLKARDFLKELALSEALADLFCKRLLELDLLVPARLQVRHQAGVQHHQGSYVVDEDRLLALSDAQFLRLREHGFLSAVYAHLISLQQIDQLPARNPAQA